MKPHIPEYREAILLDVHRERVRQNKLVADGKLPFNCADVNVYHAAKLPILVEECGEVGKAVYEEYTTTHTHEEDVRTRQNLRTELIQVAAVCVAWVEAIDEEAQAL